MGNPLKELFNCVCVFAFDGPRLPQLITHLIFTLKVGIVVLLPFFVLGLAQYLPYTRNLRNSCWMSKWIHFALWRFLIFPYLRQAKCYNDYFYKQCFDPFLLSEYLENPCYWHPCGLLTFVDLTWKLVINAEYHPPSIYQMNPHFNSCDSYVH